MKIQCTILTGYLGSGKTTFLNSILRRPEFQDTAILINEFGEVGIDQDLVAIDDDDILILEGGCICCEYRGNLAGKIKQLIDRYSPKRIIIETSGVANPIPVFETFSTIPGLKDNVHCSCVVTVVDSVFGLKNIDGSIEGKLQIASADHIVITKSDLPEGHKNLQELSKQIRTLNQFANSHLFVNDEVPEALIPKLVNPDGTHLLYNSLPSTLDTSHAHEISFESTGIEFEGKLSLTVVQGWIDDFLNAFAPYTLRLKGLLNLQGEGDMAVLQMVRDVVSPITYVEDDHGNRMNRIVVITCDIHPDLIREELGRLAESIRISKFAESESTLQSSITMT
jgi:G3E family GTPase